MNYKLIIANAIEEFNTQRTPYLSYFKREAKKAYNIDFEEFEDFFDGCIRVITLYKKHLEKLYLNHYRENDLVLHSFKQMIIDGQTTDQNGRLIQEHIERIENDKEFIKKLGYKTNYDYKCLITGTGEIIDSFLKSKHTLDYSELENLENIILQLSHNCQTDKNNKEVRDFKTFLYHPNIDALNKKLHELLDNSKGKTVAITIKALIKNSFIAGYKSNEELYKAMRKEFGDIGANSGLNTFLNDNSKKLNENDITSISEILQQVK